MRLYRIEWDWDGITDQYGTEMEVDSIGVWHPTKKQAIASAEKMLEFEGVTGTHVDKVDIIDPTSREKTCKLLNGKRYVEPDSTERIWSSDE